MLEKMIEGIYLIWSKIKMCLNFVAMLFIGIPLLGMFWMVSKIKEGIVSFFSSVPDQPIVMNTNIRIRNTRRW